MKIENVNLIKGASVLLFFLMSGNIFFVKRLVDTIDSTVAIVWDLRQQVAVLSIRIDNINVKSIDCRKSGYQLDDKKVQKGGKCIPL